MAKSLNLEEIQEKINNDPDYIYSPQHKNSLKEFLKKHKDGVSNTVIAKMLFLTPELVNDIYEDAVEKLRSDLVQEFSDPTLPHSEH